MWVKEVWVVVPRRIQGLVLLAAEYTLYPLANATCDQISDTSTPSMEMASTGGVAQGCAMCRQ